jgi:hypothetical protein
MDEDSVFRHDAIIAISGSDLKQAALFFERILPLHSAQHVPDQIRFNSAPYDIGFEELLKNAVVHLKQLIDAGELPDDVAAMVALQELHNIEAKRYHDLLASCGLRAVPIYHSTAEYEASLTSGKNRAVELTLMQVPLIDTDRLEWEHILDIRRDSKFLLKLRRFRLFINDNYRDKQPDYIRDSLLQKIQDYEEACKRHGISLTISTMSKLLNSKSLLGSLGIAAAAILCGDPAIANASLITGTTIEIGKVSLHIAEKRLELKSKMEDSEIALLMRVRDGIKGALKTSGAK